MRVTQVKSNKVLLNHRTKTQEHIGGCCQLRVNKRLILERIADQNGLATLTRDKASKTTQITKPVKKHIIRMDLAEPLSDGAMW